MMPRHHGVIAPPMIDVMDDIMSKNVIQMAVDRGFTVAITIRSSHLLREDDRIEAGILAELMHPRPDGRPGSVSGG